MYHTVDTGFRGDGTEDKGGGVGGTESGRIGRPIRGFTRLPNRVVSQIKYVLSEWFTADVLHFALNVY